MVNNYVLNLAALIRTAGTKVGGQYEVFVKDETVQTMSPTAAIEEKREEGGVRVILHLNPTIEGEWKEVTPETPAELPTTEPAQ